MKKLPLLVSLGTLMCLGSILGGLNKLPNGEFPFQLITVTLSAEVIKLLTSVIMAMRHFSLHPEDGSWSTTVSYKSFFSYSIISLIYVVDNNLGMVSLLFLSPPSIQFVGNLKTVFIAFGCQWFLKKKLGRIQWSAVVLLICGVLSGTNPSGTLDSANFGYLIVLITSVLSALGDIYNEYLLKQHFEVPIHVQNTQLYASGVVFNIIAIVLFEEKEVLNDGFFNGYSWLTWALVINSAFGGISISFVFKYLDNMTRVFAQTAAMMVGLVLSVYLFDFIPTIGFICGFVVVCVAIYLYNLEDEMETAERNGTSIILQEQQQTRVTRVTRGKQYIGVPTEEQERDDDVDQDQNIEMESL